MVFDDINPLTYLTFAISFLYFIIPSKFFVKFIFKQRILKETQEKTYEEVKDEFLTDYDRLNPVTSETAMQEWFHAIAEKEKQAHLEAQQNMSPGKKKTMNALLQKSTRMSIMKGRTTTSQKLDDIITKDENLVEYKIDENEN